jgi:hypothetical protein
VCAVLDGNQVLDFYWTDPIDDMKRSVAKLQYKDKLYTTFRPGTSALVPNERVFDMANSGMIFQTFYLLDTGCSQLVALFYADASFSGTSMTHHPIYSKHFFILTKLFLLFKLYSIIVVIAVTEIIYFLVQCVC